MIALRRIIAVVAGATATALLAASCSGTGESAEPELTTLSIGMQADVTTYDPGALIGGGQRTYWTPIYDTLLKREPDGSIAPSVAESWEYSDDLLQLTLQLRDDVTFTDGSPLTADAVVASLERYKELSPSAGNLRDVDQVIADNEHQVTIVLSNRSPALLPFLASSTAGVIGNPAAFDDPELAAQGAGSGPYVLDRDRSVSGQEYVYVRNEDYWDPDSYDFDELILRPLPETSAALNALRSGQIQSVTLDPQSVEGLGDQFEITPFATTWGGLFIVDRDGQDVPALGDVRVRQAINMVFDRESMAENLMQGYAEPTEQMFPENSAAYRSDLAGTYDQNIDRAKQLMAEAGYADGFTVTMPATPRTQFVEPTLADALGQIGIQVEWVPVPEEQAVDRRLSREFPMFYMTHAMDNPWADLGRQVRAGGTWNLYGNTDPTLEDLYTQVLAATDEEQLDELYYDIGGALVEAAWFAPLWYVVDPVAHTKDVVIEVVPGGAGLPIFCYSRAD